MSKFKIFLIGLLSVVLLFVFIFATGMFGLEYKKFFAPKHANIDRQVVVGTYEVRWWSRDGYFNDHLIPQVRVFTNKKDAEVFAKALENAFKLIKHTHGNAVWIEKTKL